MKPFDNLILLVSFVIPALFASCGGNRASQEDRPAGDTIPMEYAENLTIVRHPEYVEAIIANPWDTVRTLQTYILVDKSKPLPENLPQGTVVRIPVANTLIYSTIHNSIAAELGAIDAIGGVCNPEYIKDKEITARIHDGRITDCGNNLSPDMEKIIQLRPEVIMLSPFENNDRYAKVAELGIPIVECADYMETSGLGRAEWLKFYGLLFGKEKEAEQWFRKTADNYNRLKGLASVSGSRPKVLMDQRYGQTWSVPGGNSTTGVFIRDAGGRNPFDIYPQSGSVSLAPEKVFAEAHDADIWFVRYNQKNEKSLSELAADAAVNSRFKAFREGNVYGCNTNYVDYYEEGPFHPDRILADMIRNIHPELADSVRSDHRFYRLLK